jgi:carboxyl-terminal processing protease
MRILNILYILLLGAAPLYATSPKVSKPETTLKKEPVQIDFSSPEMLRFFEEIEQRVKTDYVEDITNRALLEGALSGMVSSLDPHSAFLNVKDFKELQEYSQGQFGGLGIEIIPEDQGIRVISPLEDAPAAKAGVKAGDLIVAIESVPVATLKPSEAVKKLRGDPGTIVNITIQRDHDIIDLKVKREIIKVRPIKWRVEGTIGYIRITTFNEKTTNDLIDAIRSIKQKLGKSLIGYVIDVRNNAGGLFEQAISATSLFLGRDKLIVSAKGKDKEEKASFKSKLSDMTEGHPLVVLINAGSASASEILAGALQDHKRAILVGTRSFGKGSVQRITPIPNLGALKLTIALYYTPSGRSIQKEGIEPDIKVDQQMDLKTINADKHLREAFLKDALKNEDKTQKEAELEALKENPQEIMKEKTFKELPDYQLTQAFNILRAFSLGELLKEDSKRG